MSRLVLAGAVALALATVMALGALADPWPPNGVPGGSPTPNPTLRLPSPLP